MKEIRFKILEKALNVNKRKDVTALYVLNTTVVISLVIRPLLLVS